MTIDIVKNYKTVLDNIAPMIEVSGYRQDYIGKKLGLSSATFSAKKQKGNWTPDEIERLLGVITNEDVEDYMLMKLMESIENEETISYDEFKSEMIL